MVFKQEIHPLVLPFPNYKQASAPFVCISHTSHVIQDAEKINDSASNHKVVTLKPFLVFFFVPIFSQPIVSTPSQYPLCPNLGCFHRVIMGE